MTLPIMPFRYWNQLGDGAWQFNPGDADFSAAMDKRASPGGPFDAAPIIQGKFAGGSGVACDVLSWGRGTQVADEFFDVVDPYQGTIVFWWTPETARTAAQTNDEYLFSINEGEYQCYYEHDNQRLTFEAGNQTASDITFNTVAGQTYCVILRWDCDNDLDGTNYICVSVDDTHTFGRAGVLTANAPDATIKLGHHSSSVFPSNAIIEGFTIYRRVLYDGANGTPATSGVDELNLIYAAGAGKKPWEVCPEDVVMAFPTNGTAEELSTGTGEAFYFPYRADNELLNWHMQDDTGGAPDDWTAVNAPTLADAAAADIFFGTRSQKISVDAANEGIYQEYSCSAGDNFWIGAWVKDDGANKAAKVDVYDVENTNNMFTLISADSGAWEFLTACFEVVAGCSTIRVYIRSVDADTYDFHVAQCMVLPNLVDNGGMEGTYVDESGGGGGTVNVAPGWEISGCETDGTDELSEEGAIFHSGGASQKAIVDAANEGVITDANCFTSNKWHLVTVWLYGDTTVDVNIKDDGGTFLDETVSNVPAAWTRYAFVTYATAADKLIIESNVAGTFYIDDVSVIELDDITITATPASAANSVESYGIRVDGRDTLTQTLSNLSTVEGKMRFNYLPRHTEADALKLGHTTPFIFAGIGAGSNYIQLYWAGVSQMRLAWNGGGGESNALWATGGAFFTPGTKYVMEIQYDATSMRLYVDDTLRLTVAGAVTFASVPTTAWMGSTNAASGLQGDAVFS